MRASSSEANPSAPSPVSAETGTNASGSPSSPDAIARCSAIFRGLARSILLTTSTTGVGTCWASDAMNRSPRPMGWLASVRKQMTSTSPRVARARPLRRARDAYQHDPATLHALGAELKAVDTRALALDGHMTERVEHQATDRVPLFRRELGVEKLVDLVDRGTARHPKCTAGEL